MLKLILKGGNMYIRAINKSVVVLDEKEVTTKKGLLLLEKDNNDTVKMLKIISVSEDIKDLKIGDYIVVDKALSKSFSYEDKTYLIFKYSDILLKVENEKN